MVEDFRALTAIDAPDDIRFFGLLPGVTVRVNAMLAPRPGDTDSQSIDLLPDIFARTFARRAALLGEPKPRELIPLGAVTLTEGLPVSVMQPFMPGDNIRLRLVGYPGQEEQFKSGLSVLLPPGRDQMLWERELGLDFLERQHPQWREMPFNLDELRRVEVFVGTKKS